MRFVVCSDAHLDAATSGVKRFEEVQRAMRESARVAIEKRVDGWVFAGDLGNPDSGSCVFRIMRCAIEIAVRLSREGIPSYWIAGNHCVIEDGSGDTFLTPLRALGRDDVYVVERPYGVTDHGVGHFVFLPYTATSHPYDTAETARVLIEAALKADGDDLPIVVVGHLSVAGIVPGEETVEMGRGREVLFPYEVCDRLLAGRRAILMNGHIHRRQVFFPPGGRMGVHIPGSLARLTFGEERNEPSYLLVEV